MKELPQDYAEALEVLAIKVSENTTLQAKNTEDNEKVEFYDRVCSTKGLIDFNSVVKVLKKVLKIKEFGEEKLLKFLKDNKILMKSNIPYQKHIENGNCAVIQDFYILNGDTRFKLKTMVTQKGLIYISRKIHDMLIDKRFKKMNRRIRNKKVR